MVRFYKPFEILAVRALSDINIPWFQRLIFIIFIAKGRGKINLWNQGNINRVRSGL
jgi:hypothetical protein